MPNEYFNPTYSTDNIWREQDMERCLSDDLNTIEADITALETGKAASTHTHTEYASSSDIAALQTLVGDTSVATQINTAVAGKADASHTHTEYAAADHVHTGYAATDHTHTGYATETYVNTQVAGLVDSAPETLNTLNELAAALGDDPNFATTIATQIGGKANAVHAHDDMYYTESEVNTLLNAKADVSHMHNVFGSLTEIGITTFPTTMSAVAAAMPANSLIVIDTRRVNGSGTGYDTEIISDWNNATNGMALIMKGATTARITMMILYGSSESDHGDFTMGNYAITPNTVNWTTLDSKLDEKVDKISKLSAVDLNTITETGLYYVSSGTEALHYPAGSNGHMIVMSDGTRVRQIYFRVGTVDTNSFQWYSRHLGSDTTVGDNGWSQWWLLSGCEMGWSGTAGLNDEINLGSRYGCQAWVVAGQVTTTDTYSTVYIPRYFLTTNTTKHKLQIADETGYVSFYFYYKESDNNVYAKVVWVSDSDNSALRYVYRVS